MKREKRKSETARPAAGRREAAEWFVELDARAPDAATDAAFARWLADDDRHVADWTRCETAAILTARLRDDPDVGWAFHEAARLAAGGSSGVEGATGPQPPGLRWFERPALAWGAAGFFALVALAAWIAPDRPGPAGDAAQTAAPPAAADSAAPAQQLVIDFGAMDPVVLLPGETPVDARAIAVMPFAPAAASADASAAEASRLAADLYARVLDQLERIPGLYVVGADAVEPYAVHDVSIGDIAAQLGVRGIVRAHVTATDGRVRVVVSLIDAASNRLLVDGDFERPIAEMPAMQTEIATEIAVALANTADDSQSALPN